MILAAQGTNGCCPHTRGAIADLLRCARRTRRELNLGVCTGDGRSEQPLVQYMFFSHEGEGARSPLKSAICRGHVGQPKASREPHGGFHAVVKELAAPLGARLEVQYELPMDVLSYCRSLRLCCLPLVLRPYAQTGSSTLRCMGYPDEYSGALLIFGCSPTWSALPLHG